MTTAMKQIGAVNSSTDEKSEWLALAGLTVVSLVLNLGGLRWGLPNRDVTWATDALTPVAPLSIAYRLFKGGWNSGWFYFKYPNGYPLLLAGVYAPYLLWLRLTHGLGAPATEYPYGFARPEQALMVLALLGRCMSALMITAAALLWYSACRELFSRRVAWLAAWLFATLFPVVYYAHTTNVEAPMVFWIVLALYGAARVYARGGDRGGMLVFGVAAAMALATKEQAIGLLIVPPLVLLVDHVRRRRQGAVATLLPAGTVAGLGVSVALFCIMTGALVNPLGVWHRIQFLTHTLPDAVRQKYAPYYFAVDFSAARGASTEIIHARHTAELMAASMGWPLLLLAVLGGAIGGWRRSGVFIVSAAAGYYILSVRALDVLTPRYILPLCVLATVFAALALDRIVGMRSDGIGRGLAWTATAAVLVFCTARGADATRLLRQDTRYAAEHWLTTYAAPDRTIEVYQRPTYLPRFPASDRIVRVSFDDISISGLLKRRPDLVVLSSAGLPGVTTKYATDWRDEDAEPEEGVRAVPHGSSGRINAFEYDRNRTLLEALEQRCLGYEAAVTFEKRPWLAAPIIGSLAPTIWIYRRVSNDGVAGADVPANCRALIDADLQKSPRKGDE